jgi:hypothetical protein
METKNLQFTLEPKTLAMASNFKPTCISITSSTLWMTICLLYHKIYNMQLNQNYLITKQNNMHNNGVNMWNKWNIKSFALYSLLVGDFFFKNAKMKGSFVFLIDKKFETIFKKTITKLGSNK